MVLEAVMVVVDNSESSRNGDYTPTRFEAQSDAVSLIFSAITQANPESSVGLMSMGGKGPEVLVTLTTDHGKILEGLHRTKSKIRGGSHLATGIQIAGVSLFLDSAPSTVIGRCTDRTSLPSSIDKTSPSVNVS
jgi:26S proteasome regulatory subunit N10